MVCGAGMEQRGSERRALQCPEERPSAVAHLELRGIPGASA
jgi:hypothetical protein